MFLTAKLQFMMSVNNEEWRLMIIIIDVLNLSQVVHLTVFLKYAFGNLQFL